MHLAPTLLTALLSLSGALAQSPNTCSDIKPTGDLDQVYQNYYKNYDPVRISKGIVCSFETATSDNGTCSLQSWAYISYGTRFNATFSDAAQRDALIDTISHTDGDPIVLARNNISGIVPNETFQVLVGESAYVQFAEEYSCRTFLVSGCQGILEEFDDTYIEACYPVYNTGSGTIPMFYTESSLIRVNPETARGMTDHPYAVNNTGLGPNMPCTGANSTEGCGAMGSNGSAGGSGATPIEQQEGSGAGTIGVSILALAGVGLAFAFGPL